MALPGATTAVCVQGAHNQGPPGSRAVVTWVVSVMATAITCVLQVLDVTPRRSGSQININAGVKWAEEGGGRADCGDG